MPAEMDFGELNASLSGCRKSDAGQRKRWEKTVDEQRLEEREKVRPLPEKMPEACVPVTGPKTPEMAKPPHTSG